MARREAQKILVIKLSALGDFVLALAAMKKIDYTLAVVRYARGQPVELLGRTVVLVERGG